MHDQYRSDVEGIVANLSSRTASGQTALVLAGVRHAYDRVPVLRSVSLQVEFGEIVALLGANGAGKTSLLRVAATLDRPLEGAVVVAGHDARTERRRARAALGFVARSLGSQLLPRH
jgi:ABC-type multidrug transport system ATPase subunit